MKVRYLGTLLLAVLTFFGCDDNTGTLGLGMLPDSDGMSAHTTTFNVTTRSFAVDSVFAKTSTVYRQVFRPGIRLLRNKFPYGAELYRELLPSGSV